jgi:CHAD domain-containing protein
MAYAFKQATGVAGQVREIAAEQVDKSLDVVRANANFDETVHSLRKSSKKLRALLRLVRPAFEDYDAENEAIRAMAEQFSVARDAAVMVETMSGLLGADAPAAERQVLARLEERAVHLRRQVGEETLLGNAVDQLGALRERIERWTFSASGRDIVLPGLQKSYARFREELDSARGDPDGEVMHDWRKAAKVHWYHVRLFERAAPDVLTDMAARLERLGESLGDHHNLVVLSAWIDTALPTGGEGLEALRSRIAERQSELAESSFSMADQFTVEKAAALAKRFGQYWQLLE